jgi:hypothetical protein
MVRVRHIRRNAFQLLRLRPYTGLRRTFGAIRLAPNAPYGLGLIVFWITTYRVVDVLGIGDGVTVHFSDK